MPAVAGAGLILAALAAHNMSATRNRSRPLRQRKLAVLNAQWRGGSTLAEQLIFSTTIAPPFVLDEPAKAMWLDSNNHRVSSVNFNALRCDFSQFNHTLLLNWQHWRKLPPGSHPLSSCPYRVHAPDSLATTSHTGGEFTRQRKLLNHKSFEDMRRKCFNAGNGGHVRAVKTIRMTGELDLFSKNCVRERTDGNYSCLLIQLIRHPLSTLKSERNSARLPQVTQRASLDRPSEP
jgi:hypothetical protein